MIFAEVVRVTIDNYTLFSISILSMWSGMIFFELRDINKTLKNK